MAAPSFSIPEAPLEDVIKLSSIFIMFALVNFRYINSANFIVVSFNALSMVGLAGEAWYDRISVTTP